MESFHRKPLVSIISRIKSQNLSIFLGSPHSHHICSLLCGGNALVTKKLIIDCKRRSVIYCLWKEDPP